MVKAADQIETRRSAASSPPPRRRTLLVFAGESITTRPLPLTGELVLGRGEQADLILDDGSISRAHLRLVLAEDRVSVVDLESANGTMLRGARLPSGVGVEVTANEPITIGDVTLVIQEIRPLGSAIASTRSARDPRTPGNGPIVIDPAMRRLYDLARRISPGTITVLIVGETGTGKERLAEFLHGASRRAAGPLVRINCAAFADPLVESELFGHEAGAFTGAQRERRGLLESAKGGTVFLDEIGELSLSTQAKLLRVLEEGVLIRVGGSTPRPLDVRFIAATNRDLDAEIAAGRFRQDLYFRIAGSVLAIPPLRERLQEIEPLAHAFAADAMKRLGRPAVHLSDAAVRRLCAHSWPGNVRELRNVIERAALISETASIEEHHLPFFDGAEAPAAARQDASIGDELAELERRRILDALEQCAGNQTRAAALLGMPRRTFIKRLSTYGVQRPRKR
ncbi:MAG TPA: sigma 54-interacting transcriptional regulator [Kofleriaceae bacterium]|jgi:DNA-binding NtrC family response regulator|nr:sigma 54-interacting transcriptional regulator [Kofleriaceae bacterium]